MPRIAFALILLVAGCGDDTACVGPSQESSTDTSDEPTTGGGASPVFACCKTYHGPDDEVAQCSTHPFGRKPYCGGVEEPQTFQGCMSVLEQNPGLCVSDYVACRDAIRLVACDVCPPECEGIEGACDP